MTTATPPGPVFAVNGAPDAIGADARHHHTPGRSTASEGRCRSSYDQQSSTAASRAMTARVNPRTYLAAIRVFVGHDWLPDRAHGQRCWPTPSTWRGRACARWLGASAPAHRRGTAPGGRSPERAPAPRSNDTAVRMPPWPGSTSSSPTARRRSRSCVSAWPPGGHAPDSSASNGTGAPSAPAISSSSWTGLPPHRPPRLPPRTRPAARRGGVRCVIHDPCPAPARGPWVRRLDAARPPCRPGRPMVLRGVSETRWYYPPDEASMS
jgi:hypothetical protein